MSEPTLVFLPWVDRGGMAALPADRADAHPASRVSTSAEVVVNDTGRASVDVELMGPGDVTALAAQQVIRTDPASGVSNFESNYLTLVELDEPSLPWLLTPASAVAGRLRPWLCLVVVAEGPGVRLDAPGSGLLPVLRIGPPARPEVELPDLADSWAWAHAQVAPIGDASPAAIVAALDGDPARNLSRLVCGRLLAPQRDYLACVVPTFESGRRAGLGDDPTGAEGPAWSLGDDMTPVELPVYHHWRFSTGPAGDFQSLALAIRGRPVPDGFGSRPIDLSTAGLGLSATDDAQVRLGGALRALDAEPVEWSDPELPALFATALTEVLNAPDIVPAATPLLAPPRYGASYRPAVALDPSGPPRWYEQLNGNPAGRVAAALGVQVVQRDQEVLVASAWDQAADFRAASALARLSEAGIAVADRMRSRHLASLPADTGVFVVAPLIPKLPLAPDLLGPLLPRIRSGSDVSGSLGASVRRVTRVRGATVRRVTRPTTGPATGPATGLATGPSPGPVLAELAGHIGAIAARSRIPGVLVTFDVLGAGATAVDSAWRVIHPAAFADAPPQPFFAVRPLRLVVAGGGFRPGGVLDAPIVADVVSPRPGSGIGTPRARPRPPGEPELPDLPEPPDLPDPPDPPRPPRVDSADAAAFRELVPRHLAEFLEPPRPPRPIPAVVDVGAIFRQVITLTTPADTFRVALGRLLVDSATPGEPTDPDPTDPGNPAPAVLPAQLSPRFAAPMATSLAELGQEWLLPGLDGVPANTALALRTNSVFVQAFMIGLNHELGRELLWREFPTPLTATFFRRFWDSAVDPAAPPDIDPLLDWGDRPLGDTSSTGERLVLLLRSELLRRFPDALVTAVRAGDTRMPVFAGSLQPDVRFLGFAIPETEAEQWSIVIAEQPGAPRFGFEVGEAPAGVSHAPAPDPTSAALAHRLRQLPARITIPVSVLLRRPQP